MLSSARNVHTALFVAFFLVSSCVSSHAKAELFAYEPFDYESGEIVGKNGGTGFNGAWFGATGTTSVVAGGLTYTDSAGNQLVTGGSRAVASGATNSATDVRDLASARASGTTWWSFIGQRLSPHATLDENVIRSNGMQIFNGPTPGSTSGQTELLSIGKGTTASPSITYNWSMLHSGQVANAVQTAKPITTQSFVLARIDHLGDGTAFDNVYLWVNPLLGVEPNIATAEAQFIGARDLSFNRIRAFAGNANAQGPYADFAFDEIRFGSTFADVTPHTMPGGQPGDFNGDNKVDAADYVVWRETIGTDAKYNEWRMNFGTGAGAALSAVSSIPEPVSLLLLLLTSIFSSTSRIDRRSRLLPYQM